MLLRLTTLITALLVICAAGVQADLSLHSWTFDQEGTTGSWFIRNMNPGVVQDGRFVGVSTNNDPYIFSPVNLNVAADHTQYIQVRMRLRLASGEEDRFGANEAAIFFLRVGQFSFLEAQSVKFKAYGNGEWKTYNIPMYTNAEWSGTINRIRVDPCSLESAQIEIAWVKFNIDQTPPRATFKSNMWNYKDSERTSDNTPTFHVGEYYDLASGVWKVEFLRRPAGGAENTWVLWNTDNTPLDGLSRTSTAIPNGAYDFGVKVYDKAGNFASWLDDEEFIIRNVLVDTSLQTEINLDMDNIIGHKNPYLASTNAIWSQWRNLYNPTTKRLPETLENAIKEVRSPILRYPGGCYSDTFYWKQTIGPISQRVNQFLNGCSPVLIDGGPPDFGIDEFLQFCEDRGFEPMLTNRFRWPGAPGAPFGLDAPDPYEKALQDAIDLVEYCNAPNDGSNPNGGIDWAAVRAANGRHEPYNVKYFEIGNEPWGPDPYGSPVVYQLDGASLYSISFHKYVEGMKAVDPTIKVAATAHLQSNLSFNLNSPEHAFSVYQQLAPFIDYAQGHPYLPYSGWQSDKESLYWETMATPKAIDDMIGAQRVAQKIAYPELEDPIKLWFTEWNINYNWFDNPDQGRINAAHTRSLKAAMATLDAFRVFQYNDDIVDSAQWWYMYGGGYWSLIINTLGQYNPAAHVFRVFNSHMGENLVDTKVVASPKFNFVKTPGSIIAGVNDLDYLTSMGSVTPDGRVAYLWVINKDKYNAHSATIHLQNYMSDPGQLLSTEIWEITAPNVDDVNNPLSTTTTESSAVFGQSFNYSFPKHSVTSFRFVMAPVQLGSLGSLKGMDSGIRVEVLEKIVTAGFPSDVYYIQEQDRSSGIRVVASGATAVEGNKASVTGLVELNEHGEPYILADGMSHDASAIFPAPLGMIQRQMAGPGLENTGLLVRVWGTVTGSGDGSFYLNDGTGLISSTGNLGVKVIAQNPPAVGKYVLVTGIRSLEVPTEGAVPEPVIRVRKAADVEVLF